MIKKAYKLTLDLKKGLVNYESINFVSEDNGCNVIEIELVDAGVPVSLADTIVRFVAKTPSYATLQQDATVKEDNVILVELKQSFFSVQGIHSCEVQLYNADNQTLRVTFPAFRYYVTASLMNDKTVQADNNFTILQGMINDVKSSLDVASEAKNIAEDANKTSKEAFIVSNEAQAASNNAFEVSKSANATAQEANTKSNEAKASAKEAVEMINKAHERINEIKNTADNAKAQVDKAVLTANGAMTTSNNAKDVADIAVAQVNAANIKVDEAITKANNVNVKVNEISNVAEQAKVDANDSLRVSKEASAIANEVKTLSDKTSIIANDAKTVADDAILTSNNALNVSNQSKTVADNAMQVANNAAAKADEIVSKGDYAKEQGDYAAAQADYAKEQGDYAKVEAEKAAHKVTINGEAQEKINFVENQVVQDGLLGHVKEANEEITTNSLNSKSFTVIFKVKNPTEGALYFVSFKSTGVSCYTLYSSYSNFYVNKPESHRFQKFYYGEEQIGIYSVNENKISLTIYNQDGTVSTLTEQTDNPKVDFTSVYSKNEGLIDLVAYNRQLTPQEIQHNLYVLSSNPSINKINDYAISTTTDYVQDKVGRTQEEINRTFYKRFCKEFTSNGEDITVENGLDGYLLNAKMEGQTIKNYWNKDAEWTPSGFYKNIEIQGTQKGTYTIYGEIGDKSSNSGDACFGIKAKNQQTGAIRDLKIYYSNSNSSINLKVTLEENEIMYFNNFNIVEDNFNKNYPNFVILEGDWTDKKVPIIPYGLSSTKATITNNGNKYSFYNPIVEGKTIVMKALKGTDEWIEISANETRDVDKYNYKMESFDSDFGSALYISDYVDRTRKVKVINTKEIVLDGSEASTPYLQRTDVNVFKIPAPGIINERGLRIISNNLKTLDILNATVNEEGICTYIGYAFIAISKTKAPNLTGTAIKEYLKQQYDNGTPIIIRYKLATPLEIPMTDEEIAKYDTYKQIIELNKIDNVCDTLEILEDGSGIYTQNINTTHVNVLSGGSLYGTHDNEVNTIAFYFYFGDSRTTLKIGEVLCDKFKSSSVIKTDKESIHSHANGYVYVRILRSRLETEDFEGLKKWVEKNGLTLKYMLINPIVTKIPKELMPTIATYETNKFSFGDEVKPSKVAVYAPIDKIAQLETKIQSIQNMMVDLALDK